MDEPHTTRRNVIAAIGSSAIGLGTIGAGAAAAHQHNPVEGGGGGGGGDDDDEDDGTPIDRAPEPDEGDPTEPSITLCEGETPTSTELIEEDRDQVTVAGSSGTRTYRMRGALERICTKQIDNGVWVHDLQYGAQAHARLGVRPAQELEGQNLQIEAQESDSRLTIDYSDFAGVLAFPESDSPDETPGWLDIIAEAVIGSSSAGYVITGAELIQEVQSTDWDEKGNNRFEYENFPGIFNSGWMEAGHYTRFFYIAPTPSPDLWIRSSFARSRGFRGITADWMDFELDVSL